MPEPEHVDAVIVGANIRGLLATYVLNSFGYRAVLLERAPFVGGADATFRAPDGTQFEYGMHVLDEYRSEIATRLFAHVLRGEFHRTRLKRAIVLRSNILPYSPEAGDMPEELRRMLPGDDLKDDIGDDPPTRQRLASCYGREFSDMIFDEVLRSFPTESRHLGFGVDESLLTPNIYPWFFPKAWRKPKQGDESRAFHDRLRQGTAQYVLYPKKGGFGAFSEAFLDQYDPERIEVLSGVGDLEVSMVPGTHTVDHVSAAGRRFKARHYFWAAGWPALCGLLDIPCQDVATDRILIGSFRLNRPAATDYHEILVGDPDYQINRVYFPARFRDSTDPLMQVEYAFPLAEDRPLDADHWQAKWVEDLTRLGIMDTGHRVEMFDFKHRPMHYNAFGMEGEALRDADPSMLDPDSNIHPVTPSMANLNLNSHVPRTILQITSVLADTTPDP